LKSQSVTKLSQQTVTCQERTDPIKVPQRAAKTLYKEFCRFLCLL